MNSVYSYAISSSKARCHRLIYVSTAVVPNIAPTTSTSTTKNLFIMYLLCARLCAMCFINVVTWYFLITQKMNYHYYHFIGKDTETQNLINSPEYIGDLTHMILKAKKPKHLQTQENGCIFPFWVQGPENQKSWWCNFYSQWKKL